MKYRADIEGAVKKAFERLFKNKRKMDFVISQGGFEKYFQFEVAAELDALGFMVHVEGKHRSDILIYESQIPVAVIEMGAGFVSQKDQENKPDSDYKSFLKTSKKDLAFSGVEFYSLMILGMNNRVGKIPSTWKQVSLISKAPIDYQKKWKSSGFEVVSRNYLAAKLGLSVSLLWGPAT